MDEERWPVFVWTIDHPAGLVLVDTGTIDSLRRASSKTWSASWCCLVRGRVSVSAASRVCCADRVEWVVFAAQPPLDAGVGAGLERALQRGRRGNGPARSRHGRHPSTSKHERRWHVCS
jgi:hypothetical protein